MDPVAFSAATALVRVGEDSFAAAVHPEYTIAGKPNGGYLLAMMGAAAAAVGPHAHVIAASTHYLHSPDPGPITVSVSVLRAGRSASQSRVRMLQDDRPCVEALVTTSTLVADSAPYWAGGLPSPGTTAFSECPRIPGTNPSGARVAINDQVDLRIDPADLGFASGRPSGRGELRGWLALPHDESFDPSSLLYAVDAFPPATFDVEMSGWVPTLELTAYVRALPAPGPVRVLQKAHVIDAQRVDEACFVWDSAGRLVAQATQLAGIRLG